MNEIIIGKGNLAGKGVYANRDFKKGEIVITYHLLPLTDDEYGNSPESERMFMHQREGIIYYYSEPERYVNHSSTPNTYQDFIKNADVAMRDISKEEMITTNSRKEDF